MLKFLSTSVMSKMANIALVSLLLCVCINVNAQCTNSSWKKLSQGTNFSIALKTDGTIWMWGLNSNGVRGNGATTINTVIKHPEQIGTDSDWVDISVGRLFVLALKQNGDLYGWGDNSYGNLGLGNNTDQSMPVKIASDVKSFSAGYYLTMIVKNNGTMWGSGYNDFGCLGIGNNVGFVNVFTQESSNATNWDKTFGSYYNSFAIKTNGTLWSTGTNVEGQTGLGLPGGLVDDFTQVGTDTNWDQIAAGVYHVLGLKTNGKLWGWGASHFGRLGINGSGDQYYRTPQAIQSTLNFKAIAAGWDNSSVIRADGTLYAGGSNAYGKLGIGSNDATTSNSNFAQVGTSSNWASIPTRSGEFNSGAINESAEMSATGADNYSQLGNYDGTNTNSNSMSQVTCTDMLGVDDISKNNAVTLYPNPAKDVIHLSTKAKISEIKIYNITGALVKTNTNVVDNTVNISQLKPGVYIVKINNSNDGIKFIKN
jgi:hypothetical protein